MLESASSLLARESPTLGDSMPWQAMLGWGGGVGSWFVNSPVSPTLSMVGGVGRTRNDLAHADTVVKRCGVQEVISSWVLPVTIRSAMAFPMPGLSKMPFFSAPVAR